MDTRDPIESTTMPKLSLKQSVALTDLTTTINRYRQFTPGIYVCLHVPVLLHESSYIVPGLVAMVNHGRLKQCEPTDNGFQGPPNFVLDVFEEADRNEYKNRRSAFERVGVIEYVAVFLGAKAACFWNRLDGSEFEAVSPDERGVIKSKALPGLWFSTHREEGQESWSLGDGIEAGVTRLGHHEFMETIFHTDGRDPAWGDWMPFDAG